MPIHNNYETSLIIHYIQSVIRNATTIMKKTSANKDIIISIEHNTSFYIPNVIYDKPKKNFSSRVCKLSIIVVRMPICKNLLSHFQIAFFRRLIKKNCITMFSTYSTNFYRNRDNLFMILNMCEYDLPLNIILATINTLLL